MELKSNSHDHSHNAHGHVRGIVDLAIIATEQGIRAVKASFWGLAATASLVPGAPVTRCLK